MKLTSTLVCALLSTVGLASCDDNYIAFTLDGAGSDDAGSRDAGSHDAGPEVEPPVVVAMCGETDIEAITETTQDIEVDTRGMAATSTSLCGEPAGRHVFMAIDSLAGESWHVHLASLDPGGDIRMAVLTSACNETSCEAQSSFCDGGSDEHFSFEAPSEGRYWIAMDDASEAGGRHRASVYRLVCGDGVERHGEGCDDGNLLDGDGCDRRCRVELSTLRVAELEPNDNRIEANALVLEGGALTVSGEIAGIGACAYPDVYMVAHPGGTLRVGIEPFGGTCTSTTEAPVRIRVTTAAGSTVHVSEVDLTDCASVEVSDLPAGEYAIEISAGQRDTALAYELTVETL